MIFQSFYNNPREYLLNHPELMMQGIITIIFLTVCFIIALKFFLTYLKFKNKTLILVGFTFLCFVMTWSGLALYFLVAMIFNTILPMQIYFLFHGGTIAIGIFSWVVAMSKLSHLKNKSRKIIIIFSGIVLISMQVTYIIIALLNWRLLGYLIAPNQPDYALLSEIYLGLLLVVFEIFGMWFVKESLKSTEKRNQLKGKLLLVSFIVSLIGCILEIFFDKMWILISARILVMTAAFLFYWGFTLPKWVERIFLKEII